MYYNFFLIGFPNNMQVHVFCLSNILRISYIILSSELNENSILYDKIRSFMVMFEIGSHNRSILCSYKERLTSSRVLTSAMPPICDLIDMVAVERKSIANRLQLSC